MFSADYLSLKLLRLRAGEEWASPGRGFSFLFPKSGQVTYLVSGRKLLISEVVRDVEGGGETLNGWF